MIRARDEQTTGAIRKLTDDLKRLGRYHTVELSDGRTLPGLQSVDQLRYRLSQFPIPTDLKGKRVLDIGSWDGWFSFEMERRGAMVLAIDVVEQESFLEARHILNSKVEYRVGNILRLTAKDVGYFDIVLFLGVLYHTKHPLLALERVCELSTEMACVESLVTDDGSDLENHPPLMEFYEGFELAGQFDNWIGPNTSCLLALCRTAGFARVNLNSVIENRAHVTCFRKWPDICRGGAAPEIVLVENPWTNSHDFSSERDDYVTVWFKTGEFDLNCENVRVNIGPYGTPSVNVVNVGGVLWQTNCKLPPGLPPGWHQLKLGIRTAMESMPARIPVDLSRDDRIKSCGQSMGDIWISKVTDGKTFEPNIIRVRVPESSVSAWVARIPEETPLNEISLRLDGADLPAVFASSVNPSGTRQINAMVPVGTPVGQYSLTAHVGSIESPAISISVVHGRSR